MVGYHAVALYFVGGCQFGSDFAVEGGKFGFELLQLVLFAPCFGDDCFELGNVGFESGGARS